MMIAGSVYAQEKVDYGTEPIVDTDLDALTDKGEVQIFGTDSNDPDTDDDGFFDGVEVLNGTNPLDASDPLVTQFAETVPDTTAERAPISWYFSRATGIVAYVLLWLVTFFGLSFRNPFLKRFVAPIYKLDMHIYFSFLALAFIFVHGLVLMFDTFVHLSLIEVLVPFTANPDVINVHAIAWGIIALYIMIILIITSLLRAKLPQKLWRGLHFLHVAVFALVVVHVLAIGTDFQSGAIRIGFLVSAGIVVFLYIVSLGEVIVRLVKKRNRTAQDIQQ
ncbi:MAG: ferric reductase-like transmembrane domain-containing protein [Parcubacteria group bacterium]|jgi:predicted ferric reductase